MVKWAPSPSQSVQKRAWSIIGRVRARFKGAVGGTVVSGRVTYHHEVELLPLMTMERGFESLLRPPQIAENATGI